MEITILSNRILSKEELKEKLVELAEFTQNPLSNYWNQQKNTLSKKIVLPIIKITDPLFKRNNLIPVKGEVLEIHERITHGEEVIDAKRLRIIL